MVYLCIGDDHVNKNTKIEGLKKEFLSSLDSCQFDYDSVSASKLDPFLLKEMLNRLPLIASKRFVVIRNIEKLKEAGEKILSGFIKENPPHIVLILECEEANLEKNFFKEITAYVKILNLSGKKPPTVFDITNALSRKDLKQALSVLGVLISEGIHPLQILGGVIWYWKKIRPRLSQENFCKGIVVLEDADLNIKRSRLEPQTAVETAIVKMASLIT